MSKDPHSSIIKFASAIASISDLKKQERWSEVESAIAKNLYRLLGVKIDELLKLTETQLLALVVSRGPTSWQPYRQIMLVALLKEAGDFATAKYPPNGGRGWHIRALHLLCDIISHEKVTEWPGTVPKIEELLNALDGTRLPIPTWLVHTNDRGLWHGPPQR
jgi:hypothetical protein